jgi:hypothetical protein
VSGYATGALVTAPELDVDQELILIRRFEDAMASFVDERAGVDPALRLAHQEFERSARIATNMRGHIR